jgi:hypothetical protein
MRHVHFPASFGLTSRPHIYLANGEWWGSYPGGFVLDLANVQALNAFLRVMNHITPHRPTSWVYPPVERIQ